MKLKFNLPNLITVLRIIFIPLFIIFFLQEQKLLAMLMLILFMAADKLDGFLARRLKVASNFGETLDATVDSLFGASLLIIFYLTKTLTSLQFWLIIITGVFMVTVCLFILKKYGDIKNDLIEKISGFIYYIMFLFVYLPDIFNIIAYLTIFTNLSIGFWRMKKFLL